LKTWLRKFQAQEKMREKDFVNFGGKIQQKFEKPLFSNSFSLFYKKKFSYFFQLFLSELKKKNSSFIYFFRMMMTFFSFQSKFF